MCLFVIYSVCIVCMYGVLIAELEVLDTELCVAAWICVGCVDMDVWMHAWMDACT